MEGRTISEFSHQLIDWPMPILREDRIQTAPDLGFYFRVGILGNVVLAGFFMTFESDEEEGDGRGGNSRYSGSLADGGGTDFCEFFGDFV